VQNDSLVRLYSSKTDEELRALADDSLTLTEEAKAALASKLERRSLQATPPMLGVLRSPLMDGGSKQNWAERLGARSYWTIYLLIPLFTLAHVDRSIHKHDGQVWKWITIGVAFMALAIWWHQEQKQP
jgi:hypothetical protein